MSQADVKRVSDIIREAAQFIFNSITKGITGIGYHSHGPFSNADVKTSENVQNFAHFALTLRSV